MYTIQYTYILPTNRSLALGSIHLVYMLMNSHCSSLKCMYSVDWIQNIPGLASKHDTLTFNT